MSTPEDADEFSFKDFEIEIPEHTLKRRFRDFARSVGIPATRLAWLLLGISLMVIAFFAFGQVAGAVVTGLGGNLYLVARENTLLKKELTRLGYKLRED